MGITEHSEREFFFFPKVNINLVIFKIHVQSYSVNSSQIAGKYLCSLIKDISLSANLNLMSTIQQLILSTTLQLKKNVHSLYISHPVKKEHYAKWHKPIRERQVSHDFTHMWGLMSTLNWSKTETDLQIESRQKARDRERGVGGMEGLSKKSKKRKNSQTWKTVWDLAGGGV